MTVAAMPARSRPYFGVDVLDHFLAPLMLEIDVDVGRLLALLGDEALEQQVAGRRVDRGDAERNNRPRCSPPLPRPWQRIGGSRLRAKATMSWTVRK